MNNSQMIKTTLTYQEAASRQLIGSKIDGDWWFGRSDQLEPLEDLEKRKIQINVYNTNALPPTEVKIISH